VSDVSKRQMILGSGSNLNDLKKVLVIRLKGLGWFGNHTDRKSKETVIPIL